MLHTQSGDAPEFPFVVRDQRSVGATGVDRDQKIVRPDDSVALRERLPNLSVANARGRIERQDVETEAEFLKLPQIMEIIRLARQERLLEIG